MPVSERFLLFSLPVFCVFSGFVYGKVAVVSGTRRTMGAHRGRASLVFPILTLMILFL